MPKIDIPIKKYLKVRYLLIVGFLILISFAGHIYLQENTKIIPEELLTDAINNTLEAKSYQFHTISTITIDGTGKVFSNIKGERADTNIFHVSGSMLGTEIDVYQINDTTYRLDPLTKKWIVTENNSLLRESLLMAELNPLSNFYFQELLSTNYLGKEKINGHKLYKIECTPKINNKWLDGYFKDLKYLIWIDKKDCTIKKATVNALSKEKRKQQPYYRSGIR